MTKRQARKSKQAEVEAPLYVVLITYFLCWTAGAYLLLTTGSGDWQRLVVATFLIIWPVSGTSPLDVLKAWRGSG